MGWPSPPPSGPTAADGLHTLCVAVLAQLALTDVLLPALLPAGTALPPAGTAATQVVVLAAAAAAAAASPTPWVPAVALRLARRPSVEGGRVEGNTRNGGLQLWGSQPHAAGCGGAPRQPPRGLPQELAAGGTPGYRLGAHHGGLPPPPPLFPPTHSRHGDGDGRRHQGAKSRSTPRCTHAGQAAQNTHTSSNDPPAADRALYVRQGVAQPVPGGLGALSPSGRRSFVGRGEPPPAHPVPAGTVAQGRSATGNGSGGGAGHGCRVHGRNDGSALSLGRAPRQYRSAAGQRKRQSPLGGKRTDEAERGVCVVGVGTGGIGKISEASPVSRPSLSFSPAPLTSSVLGSLSQTAGPMASSGGAPPWAPQRKHHEPRDHAHAQSPPRRSGATPIHQSRHRSRRHRWAACAAAARLPPGQLLDWHV